MKEPQIFRLLVALISDEIGRIRKSSVTLDEWSRWTKDTRLEEGEGVGIDSLALLDVVARVNQFFHLHEVGSEDYLFVRRSIGQWVDVVYESLKLRNDNFTFQSSGSTQTPKTLTHPRADLDQEVAFWAKRFNERKRILAYLPPHHIYGFLFTVLLPEALGVEVVDARTQGGPSVLARLSQPGDLIVTTPVAWAQCHNKAALFAPDCWGVSSSAPLDLKVWHGLAPSLITGLSEVYGSSETLALGWRETPEDGFTPLAYWQTGQDRWTRNGKDFACPDRLSFEDDGRFHVLGRHDGAIQIGGFNVHPEKVAHCLKNHHHVEDAHVRTFDHGGEKRLKAFVIPAVNEEDMDQLEIALRQYCRAELNGPEQPLQYRFGDQFPRNDMGKLADWA